MNAVKDGFSLENRIISDYIFPPLNLQFSKIFVLNVYHSANTGEYWKYRRVLKVHKLSKYTIWLY